MANRQLAQSDKEQVVTLFFWRSTQTQRRDQKLSVPTLARDLFCLSALKRIQSYGPLKVPLRTPKGFMDPRLRTTDIELTAMVQRNSVTNKNFEKRNYPEVIGKTVVGSSCRVWSKNFEYHGTEVFLQIL